MYHSFLIHSSADRHLGCFHVLANIKRYNIRIIGVPEDEDKKKDHEKILEEIIVENFPKMGKGIITQVQETQRVPNRINPRRNTPRHILIKLFSLLQIFAQITNKIWFISKFFYKNKLILYINSNIFFCGQCFHNFNFPESNNNLYFPLRKCEEFCETWEKMDMGRRVRGKLLWKGERKKMMRLHSTVYNSQDMEAT